MSTADPPPQAPDLPPVDPATVDPPPEDDNVDVPDTPSVEGDAPEEGEPDPEEE